MEATTFGLIGSSHCFVVLSIPPALVRSDFLYWQQCAELIKVEMEKALGPTWHVVVGDQFGAYIAHEVGKCFYFSIGQMKTLIFKHG